MPSTSSLCPTVTSTTDQALSSDDGSSQGNQQKAPKADSMVQITLVGLSVLMLAAVLNMMSVSVILPALSQDLGLSPTETFWVGTASVICATIFGPIHGSLSGIFGRKPVTMAASGFALIGTVVTSRSHDATMLLAGRSVQGIGFGGIFTLSEVILTDLVPLRQRGYYLSILNSVWALGSVGGPVVGALLAEKLSWRWIFYINIPPIVVGAALLAFFTRFQVAPVAFRRKISSIDALGIILFSGGILAVLIPVTCGGSVYPWKSWGMIFSLLTGTILLVLFVLYEVRFAAKPLIPLAISRSMSFVISCLGTLSHGLILSCSLYYVPLYFQTVKEYSLIVSGIALFPLTLTCVPAAVVAGIIITKTGSFRVSIWVGWLAMGLGTGLLCVVTLSTPNVAWIMPMVVGGMGAGILLTALNLAVLAAAQEYNQADGITIFSFFRSLGHTFGIAAGGTIFSNRVRANLAALAFVGERVDEYENDFLALSTILDGVPEAVAVQFKQAYLDSFKALWVFCCVLSVLAGLLSLGTQHQELGRTLTAKPAVDESSSMHESP